MAKWFIIFVTGCSVCFLAGALMQIGRVYLVKRGRSKLRLRARQLDVALTNALNELSIRRAAFHAERERANKLERGMRHFIRTEEDAMQAARRSN